MPGLIETNNQTTITNRKKVAICGGGLVSILLCDMNERLKKNFSNRLDVWLLAILLNAVSTFIYTNTDQT
jgi:hypothetical protein